MRPTGAGPMQSDKRGLGSPSASHYSHAFWAPEIRGGALYRTMARSPLPKHCFELSVEGQEGLGQAVEAPRTAVASKCEARAPESSQYEDLGDKMSEHVGGE